MTVSDHCTISIKYLLETQNCHHNHSVPAIFPLYSQWIWIWYSPILDEVHGINHYDAIIHLHFYNSLSTAKQFKFIK